MACCVVIALSISGSAPARTSDRLSVTAEAVSSGALQSDSPPDSREWHPEATGKRSVNGGPSASLPDVFTAEFRSRPETHAEAGLASRSASGSRGSCLQNRAGLEYYRTVFERYRSNLNPRFTGHFRPARTLSCRYVHYLAGVMRERAKSARADYERWHRGRLNRYRRLYEKWRCIHEHEGAWNSETGNGYHGGLQFDDGFQRTYGPEFMERWGNASAWPVWAQLEAAERAFHGFAGFKGRGYSPWGTRGVCGL